MSELTDDDLILGPVTYFKYPSTSEYENENGFDMQKIKPEPNMFNNQCNEYAPRMEYNPSSYFPPQEQQGYNEVCHAAYNSQGPSMFPFKLDIKSEPLDYCRSEPDPRHSPMPSHHNIPQHNSYQHPMQNEDYWNNGWTSPYMSPQSYPHPHCYQQTQPPFMSNMNESAMKKRGRKKKVKSEPEDNVSGNFSMDMAQLLSSSEQNESKAVVVKERRKHDRFNGMPEEEVSKRTLPDLLALNLDIIIIGINPGLFAAYKGHHYAGPGNHFWKCLYMSGLTPDPLTADDDYKLLQKGIGFTNMVERATKGSSDLTRKEIRDGGQILLEKLQKFKPKIAVFNGKLIFEVFSGKKEFNFGRQPDFVDGTNTYMWVMPSSSARCAQLPRASDKVPYYAALKKFRDYLNGSVSVLDENDLVFQYCKLKTHPKALKEELKLDIKEESFNDEYDEEDSVNSPLVKPEYSETGKPGRKKSKSEDKTGKSSEAGFDGTVKKKRGRPKKIRPEINPSPITTQVAAAAAASGENPSPPSSTSKYFQNETKSPSCTPKDISPSYQHQFSSPGDAGYYSQNSIESAFSTFDFHPSEIQSHLRSFLPSSKHESPCFLNE